MKRINHEGHKDHEGYCRTGFKLSATYLVCFYFVL
jgi:hypothetical protein